MKVRPATRVRRPGEKAHFGAQDFFHDEVMRNMFRIAPPSVVAAMREASITTLNTEEFAYKAITLSPFHASVRSAEEIARDPAKAIQVKAVYFEDIFPITVDQLTEENPELDAQTYYYQIWRNSMVSFRSDENTMVRMWNVVASFPNLKLVAFQSGFCDAPPTPEDISLEVLLRVRALRRSAQRQMVKRIWDDRGSQRIFRTPAEDDEAWNQQSLSMFHEIVAAGLVHSEERITIEIDTVHHRALDVNNEVEWEAGNKVRGLHIKYRCDMSVQTAFEDWGVIAGGLTGDHPIAEALVGVKELSLEGRSVEDMGTLPIRKGGRSSFPSPFLPNLEKVTLINIDMDDGAIKWFLNRDIDLKVQNIILDSMWVLAGPWNVNRARFWGLVTARSTTDDKDQVWIVGKSKGSTNDADRYKKYLEDDDVFFGNDNLRTIESDAVHKYIVKGGQDPFVQENLWAKTSIYRWEN